MSEMPPLGLAAAVDYVRHFQIVLSLVVVLTLLKSTLNILHIFRIARSVSSKNALVNFRPPSQGRSVPGSSASNSFENSSS